MIKKILIYGCVAVVITVLVLFFLTHSLYKTTATNYSYKHEQLLNNYASAETLVFGDSHAFYGLNPEYLKTKTFNASNNFQPIIIDKLLFDKHVDSFPKLKNIILTITEGNLNESYSNNLKNLKYYYANQMDLEFPELSAFNLKKYSLVFTKSIKANYKFYKNSKQNKSLVTALPNGFTTLNTLEASVPNLEESAKSKLSKVKKDSLQINKNVKRLQSIIDSCKAKRIQVYLVSFPISKPYLNGLDAKNLKTIDSTSKVLAKANSNVNYINLMHNEFFEASDFFDANHLNKKGAEKCTKLLSELID
ncbi:hypothetical protein [Lacinutrix salivirga]